MCSYWRTYNKKAAKAKTPATEPTAAPLTAAPEEISVLLLEMLWTGVLRAAEDSGTEETGAEDSGAEVAGTEDSAIGVEAEEIAIGAEDGTGTVLLREVAADSGQ